MFRTPAPIVAAPAAAWALAAPFGLGGLERAAGILQAGMPAAVLVAIIATEHGGGATTRVMDQDLDVLTREQLVAEVKRLRAGIRAHRDSSGHELCWHHPALWSLLPEPLERRIAVPEWPQFLRGCIRYRQSLDEQLPGAPRSTDEHDE